MACFLQESLKAQFPIGGHRLGDSRPTATVDTFINLGLKPKDSEKKAKKKKKGSKPSDKKKQKKRSKKIPSPIPRRKIGKKRKITFYRVDDETSTIAADSVDIAPFRPATRTSRLREKGIIIRESYP